MMRRTSPFKFIRKQAQMTKRPATKAEVLAVMFVSALASQYIPFL